MPIGYYKNSKPDNMSLSSWEEKQMRLWTKRINEMKSRLPLINVIPYQDRAMSSGMVGAGTYGCVYNDPDREGFVVKIWLHNVDCLTVIRECNAFQKYYKNKFAYVTPPGVEMKKNAETGPCVAEEEIYQCGNDVIGVLPLSV